MRLINIKAALFLLCGLVFAVGCDDDDSDFKGRDNYITSFCLVKGETTLTASILDDSLKIVVPEDFSFDGMRPEFSVSENATISPDPSTITDWDGEHRFMVTSYAGKHDREYVYSVEKSAVVRVGNVTLLTQADVDAFGEAMISEIDGNLTIGQTDGEDVIETLEPLNHLRKIKHNLTINPTYESEEIIGLENLEEVSAIVVDANTPLKKLCLPKLKRIYLDFKFSGIGQLEEIDFPELESIEGGMDVSSMFALISVKLPKLQSVSSLTINYCTSLESISVPVLEEVTTLTVTNNNVLQAIDFTSLQTVTGRFTLSKGVFENLEGFKSLATIGSTLEIQDLSDLTSLDGLEALTTVGESANFRSMSSLADLSALGSLTKVSSLYFSEILAEDYSFLEHSLSVGSLSFSQSNVAELDIREIDGLTYLEVRNNNVPLTLIGDEAISMQRLSLYAPNIVIKGIKEVTTTDFFEFWISGSRTEAVQLNVEKVTGKFSLTVVAAVDDLDLPNLKEVDGEFGFYIQGRSRVNLPKLTKIGSLSAGHCCNMELLSLPALETVKGDFNIRANDSYGGHLDGIYAPALRSIGGKLTLNAWTTRTASLEYVNFPVLVSASAVEIKTNVGLFDFSGLKSVIPVLTSDKWIVSGNGYNPQYQDMVNGNWKKE